MIVEGQVGPRVITDGSNTELRLSRDSSQVVQDSHGRYQEASLRGNVFTASNVAAQAVSVALTTTYTGLCLSNPVGSIKNLVLLTGQYALTVAPVAIASLHLIAGGSSAGVTVHTTPLAAPGIQRALIGPQSGVAGQAGTQATCDSACTIVNPYYLSGLGSGFTAGALYATTPAVIDFGGLIVVAPGGWVAWGALTAVTGFGSFSWEEVPI